MSHQGNDVNPLYSPHKLMEFHNYSSMSPYICYVDLCQGLKSRGLPISPWSFRSMQLPILMQSTQLLACLHAYSPVSPSWSQTAVWVSTDFLDSTTFLSNHDPAPAIAAPLLALVWFYLVLISTQYSAWGTVSF